MKCTTVLHGGACHRISTPYRSGNTMKRRMTKKMLSFTKETFTGRGGEDNGKEVGTEWLDWRRQREGSRDGVARLVEKTTGRK